MYNGQDHGLWDYTDPDLNSKCPTTSKRCDFASDFSSVSLSILHWQWFPVKFKWDQEVGGLNTKPVVEFAFPIPHSAEWLCDVTKPPLTLKRTSKPLSAKLLSLSPSSLSSFMSSSLPSPSDLLHFPFPFHGLTLTAQTCGKFILELVHLV